MRRLHLLLAASLAAVGPMPAAMSQSMATECSAALAPFGNQEEQVRQILQTWPFGRITTVIPDLPAEDAAKKDQAARTLYELKQPLEAYLAALEDLNYALKKCAR